MPKLKFLEGEKVLCLREDGLKLYEAKCLKTKVIKNQQNKYLVHYAGWNQNYDEWLPESRVLKHIDANMRRQLDVPLTSENKKCTGKLIPKVQTPRSKKVDNNTNSSCIDSNSKESKKLSKGSQGVDDVPLPLGEGTPGISKKDKIKVHRKNIDGGGNLSEPNVIKNNIVQATRQVLHLTDPTGRVGSCKDNVLKKKHGNIDSASAKTKENLISGRQNIIIPDQLKPILVDDWACITKKHKLISIPAKITVQNIIDSYMMEQKKSSNKSNRQKQVTIKESLDGLIEYFDLLLCSQLLFKFEKPQYFAILDEYPNTPMSKIYGGFHLLRLFVRLRSMMEFSTLDKNKLKTITGHLNDFLKFLVEKKSQYLNMSNFINSSSEHVYTTITENITQ